MVLADYLKELEPTVKISLCYSNNWHYEDRFFSKVYEAFFIGTVQDVPSEALNKTVIEVFTAFMWNTATYILEEAQQ